ncbi:MAG: hypothetical protein H6867_03655 [Rhodospirillales bacterium]|nr:hypothetical protein [Rhodospirillales bacterium]MCB9996247.1 hypothetical protein [Rhodospirillales bacterium]
MSEQDLLKAFDDHQSKYALVATYDFDPVYFERRIFYRKGFNSAERIIILMDKGRYQERLNNQEFMASGFNRNYLVVPVSRPNGVFHPKLYLMLGDKKASAIIGSNNCTGAGTAYNMELCSRFTLPLKDDGDGKVNMSLPVIQQVYGAFRSFCHDIGPLSKTIENEVFQHIEAEHEWIAANTNAPIKLLHSHENPLWPEIDSLLAGKDVRSIFILSPFFDKNLSFLKKLQGRWPEAPITIAAQQKYSTLPPSELTMFFESSPVKHRLYEAKPEKMGRPVHAKAIAFETDKGTFWLTGSANATRAAIEGLNTESCLWFATQESPLHIFDNDEINLEEIQPSAFQSGELENPEDAQATVKYPIALSSALLTQEKTLVLDYVAPEAGPLTLRIRNFNEKDPVLSMKLDSKEIKLTDEQVSQIRGTAFCQLSQEDKKIESNTVALAQLQYFLRHRDGSGGGSGNPLNNIRETGKGLITHLDTLASPSDAAEFLHHCNIGFNDGGSHAGFRGSSWNPRDPFKPDTPPGWSNIPIDQANDLRNAIRDFVERHQKEKLEKHMNRGNINGLANFMDIFRTLNGLLMTYHSRKIDGSGEAVIPFGFITTHVRINIALLIGSLDDEEEGQKGYIAAIENNLSDDPEIIKQRLITENVAAMLVAAIDAVIEVRAKGAKKPVNDEWALRHRDWVMNWIAAHGLPMPTAEEAAQAKQEYTALV